MSSNGNTKEDAEGELNDWIELYNPTDQAINLKGFGLSDSKNDLEKWIFPSTDIEAKGFLLIWASSKDGIIEGELHSNFSISKSGEDIFLSDTAGNIVDEISLPEIPRDYSFGRKSDGGEDFVMFKKTTPGISNANGESIQGFSPKIVPSVPSGFYSRNFTVEFVPNDAETTIYYTTDGSTPDFNSPKLTGSIAISNRTEEANYFSMIPTTNHGGARGYQTPVGKVAKGTVIRTLSSKGGYEPTYQSFSYFVFPEGADKYTFPVVSIITDEKNLFSDEIGLFVPGNTYDGNEPKPQYTGNYFQRGDEWERPIEVLYFDEDGNLGFQENAGIRIHGGITRHFPQKSLRIYFRSDYGSNSIDYELFGNREYNNADIHRFLFRASGNDFGETYFRDAFAQQLVSHLDIDFQEYEPAIVFVNGEYWGIHNIRERQDKYYLNNLYGVDPDNVDLLTQQYTPKEGDNEQYKYVLDLLEKLDPSDENSIKDLEKYIDVSNHIDYMISQIYCANTDWPHNNIDFWRERTAYSPDKPKGRDGRFRWMLYDTDYGLSHVNEAEHNTLSWVTKELGKENMVWPNFVFRSLLAHNAYRERFINRYLDLLNTSFKASRAEHLLLQMKNNIEPEIEEHLNRWIEPGSKGKWEEEVNEIKEFVKERPAHIIKQLEEHFDISDTHQVRLTTSMPNSGHIKINSVKIASTTPGVDLLPYPWEGVYFGDVPIQVSALPKDEYLFDHWLINGEIVEEASPKIQLEEDTEIKAVFVVDNEIKRKPVYYWFFGTDIENDVALKEISPIYSKNNYGNKITYFPAISPYPAADTKGIMDRVNDPTEINYQVGLLDEEKYSFEEMRGLRVRNPLQVQEKRAYLIIDSPMTIYEKPKFSAAVSRTNNGPRKIKFSYRNSIDDEWTDEGLAQSRFELETDYQLIELDFGSIEGISANPEFQIRIDFEENTTGDSGNVRFNNITVEAFSLTGDDLITDIPQFPGDEHSSLLKKVYPNPAGDFINLEFVDGAEDKIKSIQIFDTMGVEIKHLEDFEEGEITIEVSNYKKGMYIIKINSNYSIESYRVLKN